MPSGMEMMVQAAVTAMIAKLSPGELEQFKTLVKSGADVLNMLATMQANQIAIMRHLGLEPVTAQTPEKIDGPPASAAS